MKALVISESQDVLDSYADFFKSMGYENLCYRWLLKAMDNLEEIQPELIFINASDYPRHWKTLVQHVRASGLSNPVVLLAGEHLNDDEQDKARFLGIYCITSPMDDDTRQKIREYLSSQSSDGKHTELQTMMPAKPKAVENPSQMSKENIEIEIVDIGEPPEADTVMQEETVSIEVEETTVEEQTAEAELTEAVQPEAAEAEAEPENIFIAEQPAPQEPAETFTFIHPTSKIEIAGALLAYNPPLLSFRPYDKNLFKQLRFAQKASGIIQQGAETLNVSIQVQGLDDGIAEVCILKSG